MGAKSRLVATPPKAGLDFAAIKVGRGFLLVSADPITGVVEEIGRYAMTVSANDIATSGNRPQFAESVVLLPEGSGRKDVKAIAEQMHVAARELGIAIVGGHTEVTPGLSRPIVAVTAFSYVKDYVSSGDVREGDVMMMTKTAGIEGTAAIAGYRKLHVGIPKRVLNNARGFVSQISIVAEAVAAYKTGLVHAMHDCTEGGVHGAAFEMSVASGLGFVLEERKVPVATPTRRLCSALSIDPLRLIGSGALLLAVEQGKERELAKRLKSICKVTSIGRFQGRKRTLLRKDGARWEVRSAPEDELWRVLDRST